MKNVKKKKRKTNSWVVNIPIELLPVAKHDPSVYPEGWDDGAMKSVHQYATCGGCGQYNRSYAKNAICIRCGKHIYLT